jgi:hypothetical protein
VYLWGEDFEGVVPGTENEDFGFAAEPEDGWDVVDLGNNRVYSPSGGGTFVAGLANIGGGTIVLETRIHFNVDGVANHAGVIVQSGDLSLGGLAGIAPILEVEQDRTHVLQYANGTASHVNYTPDNDGLFANTWYDLRVMAGPNWIDSYLDNEELNTALITGAGGGLGLLAIDPQVYFDDVRVRRYESGDPAANLSAPEHRCP